MTGTPNCCPGFTITFTWREPMLLLGCSQLMTRHGGGLQQAFPGKTRASSNRQL